MRSRRKPHNARREAAPTEQLTFRAYQMRANTVNRADRSVEAVLATDEPVEVFDSDRWDIIEEMILMSGLRMPAKGQVVLLDSHDRTSVQRVLGSTRGLRIEGGLLIGRRFFSSVQEARDTFTKIEEGHLTDGSIGYRVWDYHDIEPKATWTAPDGRTFTAGPERARRITLDWELREDSVVPIGADKLAKMRRSPDGPTGPKERTMFEKWLKKRGIDPASLTEERRAELQAEFDVEQKRAAAPAELAPQAAATTPESPAPAANADSARAEGVRLERERQTALRELAGQDVPAELLQRAITEGWDTARAAPEFLRAVRGARPGSVAVGPDRGENLRTALADALCLSRGIQPVGSEAQRNAEQFWGIGLHALARIVLGHERQQIPHDVKVLFQRAISTGSFAEILGSAAAKSLQAAYESFPSTFLAWAGQREVADFKVYNDIKLGAFGSLAEVGDAGEIEHGTLTESKETHQAKTYGRRFAVTRKMWINDDMGAFLRVPGELGMAAARNIDDIAYTALISASGLGPTMNEDSHVLFYISRTTPNCQVGATSSLLSDDGLITGKALMRKMKGLGGENINVIPRFLLVPPELEHTALKLVSASELMLVKTTPTTGAAETTVFPTKNIHQGTLLPIVEPRLSAGTNGTTAWYLIADPNQVPSLVVVYLRGQRAPVVERKDPVDVLGIGWWIYHDVGVAAIDWRGIMRSKGAA